MTINLFCHHNGFSLSRRKITWLRWHELHCWTHVSWRAFVNMKICTGAAIAALFGFMAAAELCADDVSCQHDLATRFAPEFRLDKSSVEKERCLPGHPATCQYLEKVSSMDETILLCQLPLAASQNCYILFAHCCTFVNASPLVQATVYEKRKAGYTDDICETDKSKLETVPIFYYYEAGVSWMQN